MDALTIDFPTPTPRPTLRPSLRPSLRPTLQPVPPTQAATARRQIEGTGTPESAWRHWMPLWETELASLDALVPPGSRVVVVAPHPDDEVLGCGGLLSLLAARGRAGSSGTSTRATSIAPTNASSNASSVAVIGVTDGDASHPGSLTWAPQFLAAQRRLERLRGLRHLGWRVAVQGLGIPDGRVSRYEAQLVDALAAQLRPDDVVITTWRRDGHPDHEATGRACAQATRRVGAALLEMPVWTWHWAQPGDAAVPWDRLRQLHLSGRALEDKWLALSEHQTQLQPDGEQPAVLFPQAVDRLLRSSEFFFVMERQK
ncbi:MAG: PIG-L family deacetylase [Rubrivivax sp.]|nr:MAG: PIG-L family deacetylase [Rubrivivax sp.]